MQKIDFRTEIVIELYNQGFSDREISEKTGFTKIVVGNVRRKAGHLKTLVEQDQQQAKLFDYYNIFEDLELMSALCGTLLGDGCLSKSSTRSARGTISHCIKQEEYLRYKELLLKSICTSIGVIKRKAKEKVLGKYLIKETDFFTLQLKSSPYLLELYEIFYPQGKKIFSPMIVPYLNELSLCLFYYDDGYKHKNTWGLGFDYRITNYAFDSESKLLFQRWLKDKFGIHCGVDSNCFRIARKEDVLKFKSILTNYKVECMNYKI